MTRSLFTKPVYMMTSILITNDMLSLYEKEYSRQEVATELNISLRTL
ncbi:MAG: hypothetical protein ACYTX0_33035 [Nostoc sp.]